LSEPRDEREDRLDAIVRWIAAGGVGLWFVTVAMASLVRSLPGYPASVRELLETLGSSGRYPAEVVWVARISAGSNIARAIAFGAVGIAVARRLAISARTNGMRLER
jgi:hypothetical protein